MDEATAMQVLKQYGAQPTPQNMQRVMQQAMGSDGSAVLGRSMGLQGANDESGNALDKLAFASASTAPAPQATAPMPQTVANTPAIPQTPSPRVATPTAPISAPTGPPLSNSPPSPVTLPPSNAGVGNDSNWLPWILAALGISSTAGRGAMAPITEKPPLRLTGPTPNQALPDNTAKLALEGPQKQLTGPANEAVDNISNSTSNESRRPINTNADGRNSEPSSKPTNLDSRPIPIDDSIPINKEVDSKALMKQIARQLIGRVKK